MAFVDYSKIRAGVPLDAVLAQYNIQTRKVSNSQLKSDCPLASHKAASHEKGTFSISLDKGKWYCHSDTCRAASGMAKGGDAIDLVRLLEGCTIADAAKRLIDWFPHLNVSGVQKSAKVYASEGVRVESVPHPSKPLTNPPLAFTLKDVIPAHEAIQSRGISVDTAKKFGIGYFGGKGSMANRIVFSLFENGALVGYAGRAIIEGQEPKWLLPKGLVKFCYGLERCEPFKLLVVCESFWAPPWFHERGWNCCSLMGKELTSRMEEELKPYPDIIVGMDNDEAGKLARDKIAARLKELGHKVIKSSLLE